MNQNHIFCMLHDLHTAWYPTSNRSGRSVHQSKLEEVSHLKAPTTCLHMQRLNMINSLIGIPTCQHVWYSPRVLTISVCIPKASDFRSCCMDLEKKLFDVNISISANKHVRCYVTYYTCVTQAVCLLPSNQEFKLTQEQN